MIDWITGNIETLTQAETYEETNEILCRIILQQAPRTLPAMSVGAQVSDDLQCDRDHDEYGRRLV